MQFSDTISDLLAHNRIPNLDSGRMADLLRYLFTISNKTERLGVAEAVYRHDHDHPNAFDIFLSCLFPMAEKSARRRAHKVFIYPSDWQLELMYDGAVGAVIAVFQGHQTLMPGSDAFRRYVLSALARGALRNYFIREENRSVRTTDDLTMAANRTRSIRNQAEEDIITRDLLKRVTSFPELRPQVGATLQCIQALGADNALKEHAFSKSGDPDKWRRDRGRRPILDPKAIAKAMGTERCKVHANLREARMTLRNVFNSDGKLFLSH